MTEKEIYEKAFEEFLESKPSDLVYEAVFQAMRNAFRAGYELGIKAQVHNRGEQ